MYFNVVLHFYMFTMIMVFYALFYISTRMILLSCGDVVYVFQLIKLFKFRLGLLSLQQAWLYKQEI